jgi:hypothetical protein
MFRGDLLVADRDVERVFVEGEALKRERRVVSIGV